MQDIIEQPETTESIFIVSARRCPPSAIGSRALLELMDHFATDEPLSDRCQDGDGSYIPNAEAFSALFAVRKILGPNHPAVRQLQFDLREALA